MVVLVLLMVEGFVFCCELLFAWGGLWLVILFFVFFGYVYCGAYFFLMLLMFLLSLWRILLFWVVLLKLSFVYVSGFVLLFLRVSAIFYWLHLKMLVFGRVELEVTFHDIWLDWQFFCRRFQFLVEELVFYSFLLCLHLYQICYLLEIARYQQQLWQLC